VLALLFLGLVRPCAAVGVEVRYLTSDGVSILADLYRPAAPSSIGMVLLPALGQPRSEWDAVAETIAERGWQVIVPDLRGQGESGSVAVRRGRIETGTDPAQLWRDALAAEAFLRSQKPDSVAGVVFGGSRIGAAAVAVAASRATVAPAGLILLSPEPDLAGIAVGPIIRGLDVPVLIIAGRDDPFGGETARDLYLPIRPNCRLWEIASEERGTSLFGRRPQLAIDLARFAAAEFRLTEPPIPPQTSAGPEGGDR
jgi:pimeloyl-ACP methyl ester carboxylesterase